MLHHVFERYEPWQVSCARVPPAASSRPPRLSNTFALMNLQERGQMLVGPAVEVYEGMIVGENARSDDMDVNITKEKKLTNMRASGSDNTERLVPPRPMSLEQALEFIADDECVEVTPHNVRLRKVELAPASAAARRRTRPAAQGDLSVGPHAASSA
jgi:GTP-binding protein